MTEIKYAIEGILFAAGESVKEAKLAVVLDTDINTVRNAVADLKAEYDLKKRGFNIIDINDGYQICSRPEYYVYIQEILGEQRNQPLSNAAMEALAIIAYKQPITKGMIEKIRGVNSDSCVNRLYERGLIDECGRLEAPGRPVLYKTTDTFLRCFGLSSPKELPDIDLKKLGIEPQSESNNNDEIIQKKNGNNENKENTENFIGNKEEKEE